MKLNKAIFHHSILLISMLIVVWSCTNSSELEERSWQLVWEDEFEGDAGQSPNSSNWTYDIGTGDNGWGNGEFQYYTDRPENVSLDGIGNLAITARSESFAGSGFTSARIKTQGLFEQAYGRFEARIKLPTGRGIWPKRESVCRTGKAFGPHFGCWEPILSRILGRNVAKLI